MMGTPGLAGLRAFESAARLLSFSAAAGELGVTPSAISHQIAALEESLGVRLFRRSPRSVALTEQGQLLKTYIREAFEKIAQGTSLVASDAGQIRNLRLQIYITVAVRWLLPRLRRFEASHPAINIRLDTTVMSWDFDPNRADAGLIFSVNPQQDGVHYAELLKSDLVLVCRKALSRRLASAHELVRRTKIEVPNSSFDWEVWCEGNGFSRLQFSKILQVDSLLLAIEAAHRSLGVLVIPSFIVEDDLRTGRLVSPLGNRVPQLGSWYLAYPNALRFDKAMLNLERWLKAELHRAGEDPA